MTWHRIHCNPEKPATLPACTTAEELAQQILSWIERTRSVMEQDARTYEVTRESVLIDDIEKLCQEQLQKGSTR